MAVIKKLIFLPMRIKYFCILFYDDCRLLVTFENSLDQDQVTVLCVCVSVFLWMYAHLLVFTLAQTSLSLQWALNAKFSWLIWGMIPNQISSLPISVVCWQWKICKGCSDFCCHEQWAILIDINTYLMCTQYWLKPVCTSLSFIASSAPILDPPR